MKTTELMIFDWVNYKREPIRIWEIDEPNDTVNTEQDGYNGIRCINIDEIEPIGITSEILEKNGFERIDDEYDAWYLGRFELKVLEPHLGEDEYECLNVIIKYVHELQHALKLYKIEKDIEL